MVRWSRAAAVGALLAGCSDEDWVYRPRSDAGAFDAGVVTADGAVGDRGAVDDVGTAGVDGAIVGDGGVPMGDVVIPRDDGATGDGGVAVTGFELQAQGIATTSGGSLTAGTMELTEMGFEVGQPACVGALCLTGGLVP